MLPPPTRYALLLVFEYRRSAMRADVPNPLLSMSVDLAIAWNLCINRFHIPRRNITVVTDLRGGPATMFPWEPLHCDDCNPRVRQLSCPDARAIAREIAQFTEHTVRGVREVSKGDVPVDEVFVYISCHGAQIPTPHGDDDTALIFTNSEGTSRRYLRSSDIFRLLFGNMHIEADGHMVVPIAVRRMISSPGGRPYPQFSDDSVEFRLLPRADGDEHRVSRGLPRETRMLVLMDACHSCSMTHFEYRFDAATREMVMTREPDTNPTPLCVCLSAAQDTCVAPSTSYGSAFTRYMHSILMARHAPTTLAQMHGLIYDRLPEILRRCQPALTATTPHAHDILPLLMPVPLPIDPGCHCHLCDSHHRCSHST